MRESVFIIHTYILVNNDHCDPFKLLLHASFHAIVLQIFHCFLLPVSYRQKYNKTELSCCRNYRHLRSYIKSKCYIDDFNICTYIGWKFLCMYLARPCIFSKVTSGQVFRVHFTLFRPTYTFLSYLRLLRGPNPTKLPSAQAFKALT
jgi:hypothetical protein